MLVKVFYYQVLPPSEAKGR